METMEAKAALISATAAPQGQACLTALLPWTRRLENTSVVMQSGVSTTVHKSPASVINPQVGPQESSRPGELQLNQQESSPDCSDLLLQCIPAHQHVHGEFAAVAQGYK